LDNINNRSCHNEKGKIFFLSTKTTFLAASETYQSSFVLQLRASRHAENWVTLRKIHAQYLTRK
jgi:hypothetical protein